MRKLNITAIVFAVIFLILNIVQFFWWQKTNEAQIARYTADVASLQLQLKSFGNRKTVYTISTACKAGDEVTEDLIIPIDTYETMVTDQYISDPQQVVGRYFKIAVNPGTPLLSNMFMDEQLDATTRDRDIMLDRMTVGIKAGDYVDIRITFPYGDDYIVLSHKRIEAINDTTIKMYLTEYEWNVYQGALIDYFLNVAYGCTIYADRYVEPGLQAEAIPYYAVPTNIAALLQKNPNIVNKKEAASLNAWRQQIEEMVVLFRTDNDTIENDSSKLNAGRTTLNAGVEMDRQTVKAEEDAAAAEAQQNAGENYYTDDFWNDSATGGN